MISDHFFDSDATKPANSCGVPPSASEPNLDNVALMSGDFRASLIAALSLATMGSGVPAGATSPFQVTTRKSGNPLSTIVGTSASSGMRLLPSDTNALNLPSRSSDANGAGESKTMSI